MSIETIMLLIFGVLIFVWIFSSLGAAKKDLYEDGSSEEELLKGNPSRLSDPNYPYYSPLENEELNDRLQSWEERMKNKTEQDKFSSIECDKGKVF